MARKKRKEDTELALRRSEVANNAGIEGYPTYLLLLTFVRCSSIGLCVLYDMLLSQTHCVAAA